MGNGEQPVYVAANVTRWQRQIAEVFVLHLGGARVGRAPYHSHSALDVERWAFDVLARA